MKRWLVLGGLFVGGTAFGYWLVFTWRFLDNVLPHGGLW